MQLRITLGSILRLGNTIGAAQAFAVGDYVVGSLFVIWLEESAETSEKP
jgi:hypothetical protein